MVSLAIDTWREWVFDHSFFVVLNVAVGGYWPGNPDETTAFPQPMHIDYAGLPARQRCQRLSGLGRYRVRIRAASPGENVTVQDRSALGVRFDARMYE